MHELWKRIKCKKPVSSKQWWERGGGCFPTLGHLAMSGGVFWFLKLMCGDGGGCYWNLMGKPDMLLTTLQCTGQTPQQRTMWPQMSIVLRLMLTRNKKSLGFS